tara:strand:+ start:839 stop:1480 length:642 start_codon:yes stop_codon:yes gene_type:complete
MARKHVYPVCRPGSKTFTPKNKIEGGKSYRSGALLMSETEDPDITHNEIVSGVNAGDFYSSYFYQNTDEYSEFLADLSLPPQTDQVVDPPEPWGMFSPWVFGSFINNNVYDDTKFWELINNKSWYDAFPPAGSIFCAGLKNTVDSDWRDYFLFYTTIYGINYLSGGGFPNWLSAGLFDDNNIAGGSFKLYAGQWVTYMYTGTRFVLLGSNNWV